ncbi:hypothetical protein Tco_1178742, partial [Tanacetum coccineum]
EKLLSSKLLELKFVEAPEDQTSADGSDVESEEVLKVGVDLDDDDDSDAESEEVLKVGIHLDGIHGSEMKCDS